MGHNIEIDLCQTKSWNIFLLFQLIGSFAHVSKSCHLLIERSCTTILTDLGLAVNAVVGVNLEKNEKMQIR